MYKNNRHAADMTCKQGSIEALLSPCGVYTHMHVAGCLQQYIWNLQPSLHV
jgi:hypothetical protein